MSSDLERSRLAVAAGFFLQGLVFAAIVTQMPRRQDDFGIDEAGVTGILVLVVAVAGIGSVVAGTVASRRTSAVAFRGALIAIAGGALLVGLAPSTTWLVVAFAIYGVGLGAVDAGMNMQGVQVQAELGRSVMGGLHGCWSVGGIVGALYAALAGRLDVPVAAALVPVAVLTLAVALVAARWFVAERVQDVGLSAEGLVLPWRPVLVLGAVICIFYAADTGILTWSTPFLDEALGASAGVAPLGYAAYQAGALVSRFGGDLVVRRRGARWVATVGPVVGVLGLAAVVAAPGPWVAIVGFAVAGLGLAILAPLSFSALAAAVPARSLDVAVARMNLANYAGALLGGGVIGAVASSGQIRWSFLVPLVLLPLVWATVRSFPRRDAARVGGPSEN